LKSEPLTLLMGAYAPFTSRVKDKIVPLLAMP